MSKKLLCLLFVLSSASNLCFAALSLKEYVDGREKNKLLFNVYLSAVIETIVATNVVLESEAKPPLFCTPKELITDLDYFDTQIRMYYYSNQNNKKINPNTPITLVLIEKLREQYACK